MLVERTFELGGALCVGIGLVLLAAALALGFDWTVFGLLIAGVVLTGFGVFFVRVGRDARRHRRALLALGGEDPAGSDRDPPSG